MNILILAGGTGSIALQTGLHALIEDLDGINVKVLTNAYDNGLSTGAVRQVMGGEILGPSDVRKNQTTLFKLINGSSPWSNFLDIRFTKETSAVRDYCLSEVESLRSVLVGSLPEINRDVKLSQVNFKVTLIKEAIEAYFKSPNALRIDYNDFSLANIVYAGFASANNNSLRKAASIMAKILNIPDSVIVNDDKSMFLGALSKSGKRVTDEGDIVFWGKEDDPFVDVFFTDHSGKSCTPILGDEAKLAIAEADLIILSSGTQWSSLIPTYASVGFKQAIENSTAKIIMVMNKVPDKDCPGQTSADIIDALVPKYFPESRLNVIVDSYSDSKMQVCTDATRSKINCWSSSDLSSSIFGSEPFSASNPRHNPRSLASAIVSNYFEEFSKFNTLVLDYDDTLVGRGNATPKSSEFNRQTIQEIKRDRKFSVAICTGNSIRAIKIEAHSNYPLTVYADGGINQYNYIGLNKNADNPEDVEIYSFVKCIDESSKLPRTAQIVMSMLNEHGIPMAKMENRGDAMIAIKPVDENYRDCIVNLAKLLLKDDNIQVRAAGRSTVEIVSAKLSKASAIKHILDSSPGGKVTYIGDELDNGNDNPVLVLSETNPNLICMHVSSPAKTALFLKLFNMGY